MASPGISGFFAAVIIRLVLGTLVAGALGVDETSGIDWIELILQVAFAAVGVAIVAGAHGRRRVR
ncbi:hypothetical protein AB0B94_27245 [Micromonospora sp. NPDC048986]|uniref:hypothetical protein n=1 Tax=Micromonospora sp. NPDC048986 TaxID=3155644 RepID=UPI0033D7C95B